MGAQVKREISIMKLVRHPYVVQLREVLASSSKIFLVCELITGGELFDKIVEKQVGWMMWEDVEPYVSIRHRRAGYHAPGYRRCM